MPDPTPTQAPPPTPERTFTPVVSGGVYQDPEGRFSITLAGEWTPVVTDGTYAQFAYVDVPLHMSLVTVESDDLEADIDTVLRQVGIDPAELVETRRSNFNRWKAFLYSLGDGQGVTVLAQVKDGRSYWIIATGDEPLTTNPPEKVVATFGGFAFAGEEAERAFTPPITDTDGNEIPGSIAAIETVNLGGLEQSILIRGADVTKPVLLWLHGGPGLPHSRRVGLFQRPELEENFVVVHWDQRGAGKSYSEGLTAEDMRAEKFVSDTLELTDILREMFGQEKIFLFGFSWGSALGFMTIMENSEPFHAFIAASELADWDRSQTMSYEWSLEQAKEANNSEVIQALESIQPFDPTNPEHTRAARQFLDLFRGGNLYTEGLWDAVVSYQGPEYTSADFDKFWAGVRLAGQTIELELHKFDYNLFRDFPVSPVPVHFFAGRHDHVTPPELAEEYYSLLEAPAKSFTWFENSAHQMILDEPDKTAQELIRIANEVLNP